MLLPDEMPMAMRLLLPCAAKNVTVSRRVACVHQLQGLPFLALHSVRVIIMLYIPIPFNYIVGNKVCKNAVGISLWIEINQYRTKKVCGSRYQALLENDLSSLTTLPGNFCEKH
jgi:hypothetical protein